VYTELAVSKCGRFYTGQTGHSMDTRVKEHQQHISLEHPAKSATAEHGINSGQHIQLHYTSILATKTLISFLKEPSGNDTRSTRLHGHTQSVTPALRLPALCSLSSLSFNTPPLIHSYTCSGKPLATGCLTSIWHLPVHPLFSLHLSCSPFSHSLFSYL
jgi:hypothetical protein